MKISLRQDQNGIAHMMAIVVVVVLLGVGGAGYYVWSQNKDKDSGDSTQSASSKEAEAECKRAIDDKDLCKMATNSDLDKGNYIMTISGTVEGEQVTWTIQNDGENSHTNMLGFESITYNGDTYMKDASGTWVKYPKSEEDAADDLTDDFDFSDEEASWYTKVGKEACGDKTCFHYSYVDPTDATNNAEFWFDDDEYKIRKITTTSTETGEGVLLFTYGNAKVSPPANYTE